MSIRLNMFSLFGGVILLIFGECVQRFEPEVINYKNVLVVDGHISDQAEPQTIRLSRTRPLNVPANIPETGAIVTVMDGDGEIFEFPETEAGIYQSDPAVFKGEIGETYILQIKTEEGQNFTSSEVVLKKTPPLAKVYFEEVTRLNDLGETLWGIRILVDAHDPANATHYYRWDWVENWEIKVPVPSKYDFVVDEDTVGMGYPVPKPLQVELCYDSDTSRRIMVQSSAGQTDDRISQYEIHFVSTRGFKLRSLYGIIVQQYALSEEAFNYWSRLQRTTESLGTLFDPQPYELQGNIMGVSSQEDVVLGYFDASTVSVNSLVVAPDFFTTLQFPLEQCFGEIDTVNYERVSEMLQLGFLIDTLGPFGSTYVLMAPERCSDCRVYGSLERPNFRPE